ncbi:TetR family transcriptional regulator [Clostridium zeae]|uniref:TetR family transcriptional regulator n=1 Tax=Clostridium zeae TaxID=2759022 RepID=A0ABQ1EEF0_9CLOT|nr:TetR/AcrR family transcriptional regulator [Clostridium zeae]GFZ33167.1 TetR family transcriptional regulator [Clostridium zeae]
MSRRERKKEETRSTIIGCALELFKSKGFQETSMEEIAEQSDVSKGTLYNYFPDKESILVGYFQSITAGYGEDIKKALTGNQDLKFKLNSLLDFKKGLMGSDVKLTAIYLRYRMQTLFNSDPFSNPNRSGLENVVLEIIKDAQVNNELRSDIPSIILARTFMLLAVNYFISNIEAKEPFEMDTLKNQLIELFLDGAKL